jgi:hypothetical protein
VITVVPATMDHARAIELRPGDAHEVAAYGLNPSEAIGQSLARALWAETYLADGEVAAIGGLSVTMMVGGVGQPWLLTGPACERYKKTFLKETRRQVERMRAEMLPLVNFVDADYARAVRWLRWLGFTIDPPQPMWRGTFRRFHMGLI